MDMYATYLIMKVLPDELPLVTFSIALLRCIMHKPVLFIYLYIFMFPKILKLLK